MKFNAVEQQQVVRPEKKMGKRYQKLINIRHKLTLLNLDDQYVRNWNFPQ